MPSELRRLATSFGIQQRMARRNSAKQREPLDESIVARDAALPARDIYKTEQEFTGWLMRCAF